MNDEYFQDILEAWGLYMAQQTPGLGYKKISVEGRMMIYGAGAVGGNFGPSVPQYYPPHWKAIRKAKVIIPQLHKNYQKALEYRYILNLKPIEVAEKTGKNKAAVEKWYQRGVKAFKKKWSLQSVRLSSNLT